MADPLPPVDPPEVTPPTPPKPSRRLRIALLLSLALNIAFVSAVAGVVLSGRLKDGPPRGFDIGLGPVASAFDRADRVELRDRLSAQADLRPMNRREARAMVDRLITALRAEPFDPAAVEELMTTLRDRTALLQRTAQGIVLDKIAEMSPAERAAFADRIDTRLRRRPPPGR